MKPGGRARAVRLRVDEAHAGHRLDRLIADTLPPLLGRPLPKAAVRKLIMAGAARVDGRPLRRPGEMLDAGAVVDVAVQTERLGLRSPRPEAIVLGPEAILYEDDALIAVNKPPGLPTVPTADPRRPSLVRLVEKLLLEAGGRGRPLAVHQRLDADTSGVVLFAKDPRANPGLALAFAEGGVQKTYEALTRRPPRLPPSTFTVESHLAAHGRAGVRTVPTGGQTAITSFAVLEVFEQGLLVEARPRTGRKHQIRVHLAEAGLPILGDPLYGVRARSRARPHEPRGAEKATTPRLMLHARRLSIRHPLTAAPLVIESPRPRDFVREIERLRVSARGGTRRS